MGTEKLFRIDWSWYCAPCFSVMEGETKEVSYVCQWITSWNSVKRYLEWPEWSKRTCWRGNWFHCCWSELRLVLPLYCGHLRARTHVSICIPFHFESKIICFDGDGFEWFFGLHQTSCALTYNHLGIQREYNRPFIHIHHKQSLISRLQLKAFYGLIKSVVSFVYSLPLRKIEKLAMGGRAPNRHSVSLITVITGCCLWVSVQSGAGYKLLTHMTSISVPLAYPFLRSCINWSALTRIFMHVLPCAWPLNPLCLGYHLRSYNHTTTTTTKAPTLLCIAIKIYHCTVDHGKWNGDCQSWFLRSPTDVWLNRTQCGCRSCHTGVWRIYWPSSACVPNSRRCYHIWIIHHPEKEFT